MKIPTRKYPGNIREWLHRHLDAIIDNEGEEYKTIGELKSCDGTHRVRVRVSAEVWEITEEEARRQEEERKQHNY